MHLEYICSKCRRKVIDRTAEAGQFKDEPVCPHCHAMPDWQRNPRYRHLNRKREDFGLTERKFKRVCAKLERIGISVAKGIAAGLKT